MYSCVLKNKEGIIFDEGKDFETLRETFKWASNRGRGYVVQVADDNGNEWEASVAESLSEMSFRLRTIDRSLCTSGYATMNEICLLYTSPSPRDRSLSRMPSSA